MQWLTAIDHKLLDILQKHCRRQRLDQLMAALTHLGDMGFVWLLWAVALFRNHRMESILLVGSIAVCAVVCNLIMKPLFGRSRPFESRDVELLIREPKDRSFPSGHTMASFTAAAALFGLFGGWQGALALCPPPQRCAGGGSLRQYRRRPLRRLWAGYRRSFGRVDAVVSGILTGGDRCYLFLS